jgi:hypothetical protein
MSSQKPTVLPPPLPTTATATEAKIDTVASKSSSIRTEDDDVGNRVAAALSALALATTGPALTPLTDKPSTSSPAQATVVVPSAPVAPAAPVIAVADPLPSISSCSEPLKSLKSTPMYNVPSTSIMIPTALTLHAILPKPAKLPLVSEMSAHDLVRELTSVHCMRDAETAAAIEYLESNSTSSYSPFTNNKGTAASTSEGSSDSVQGKLEIRYKDDGASMLSDIDEFSSNGLVNSFQIVAESRVTSISEVNKDTQPNVSVAIEIPSSLDASTLAFDVPRLTMAANEPTVGPAPARNALKALKMLMEATTAAGGFSNRNVFDDNISEKRVTPIAHVQCRAFPHSELSPSQSEARVQAMLERLRALTGYEYYVPIASLAQTRLGSSHVPFMTSSIGNTTGSKIKAKRDRRIFSPLSMRVPGASTSSTINPSYITFQSGVMSPQTSSSSSLFSPQQTNAITPSGSSSALSFVSNASRLAGSMTPGGPLIRPQVTTATLPSSLTPPPQAQKALARFVSRYDKSRSRTIASPASFDREYHTPLLRSMQAGLDAMVGQRREEEAHMARATLVRPQKHPQGGYYYVSVETGRAVPPHDYEKVYLAEVSFATEFINAQAIEGWAAEAATRAEELAAMTSEERALLTAKEDEAKAQKIAWWDQDVEEGVVLLPTVDIKSSEGGAVSTSPLHPLGETIAQFVSLWLATCKETLKTRFEQPPSQSIDTSAPLLLASPSASQRCIDDTVALVAARAAKLLLPAGAPSLSSTLSSTATSTAPSASESALWASVAAAVAVYVNSQKNDSPSVEADSCASGSFTLSAKGLEAEIDRLLSTNVDSSSSSSSMSDTNSKVVLDIEGGVDSLGSEVEAVLDDAIAAFGAANDEAQLVEDDENSTGCTTDESLKNTTNSSSRVLAGISLQLLPNGNTSTNIGVSSSKKKSPFKSPAPSSSLLQEEAPLETWSPSEVEVASSSLAVKRLFTGSPVNALRSAGFMSIAEPCAAAATEDGSTLQQKSFSLSLESSLFTSLEEDGAEGPSSLFLDTKASSFSSRHETATLSESSEGNQSILSAVRVELLSFETQREGLSPSSADDDEHATSSTFENAPCNIEKESGEKLASLVGTAPASPERLPASVMRIFSPSKRVATTPSSSSLSSTSNSNIYREYGSSSPQMSKSNTSQAGFSSNPTSTDLVLPAITLLSTFNGSSATVNVTSSTPPPPPPPSASSARSIAAVRLQPLVCSPISVSSFSQRAATAISTIFDENFATSGSRISLPEVKLKPVTSPIQVHGAFTASSTVEKISSPDLIFFPTNDNNPHVIKASRQSPRPLTE